MSNFWQIMAGTAPAQTVTTANGTQLQGSAGVLYNLFGPASSNSSRSEVNKNIVEAQNRGLHLSRKDRKALRRLAAHGNQWFNEDGSLKEGLSRKQAKRATKAKSRVGAYAAEIMPKDAQWAVPMEQKQARWALDNFVRNGYDTEAAAQYAKINNYTDLAGLWGGDVAATLKGGRYGQNAATAEAAYYNSLSAPQKRAYLRQRAEWAKSGLISPASGISLNNLGTVSEADMRNYAAQNISTWQNSFYGNNGYQDEYAAAHPATNSSDGALYQLYGLTPTSNGAVSWLPSGSEVRTSFPGVTPLPAVATPSGKASKESKAGKATVTGQRRGNASASTTYEELITYKTSGKDEEYNGKTVYAALLDPKKGIYVTQDGYYCNSKGQKVNADGSPSNEWIRAHKGSYYYKYNAAKNEFNPQGDVNEKDSSPTQQARDKARQAAINHKGSDSYQYAKHGGALRYFR